MTIDLKINPTTHSTGVVSGFTREESPTRLEDESAGKLPTDKTSKVNDEEQALADNSLVDKKLSEDAADKEEELKSAISDINSSIQSVQRNLKFSVDSDLDKIVINVTDRETDKVVRQIPSEDVLDLARKLHDMVENKDSESNASTKSMLFNSTA